ncbi:MAG TPA: NADH-quinone oxidoreductase subunit H [Gemmatimonadales bacterium]|nr:NADH-quinone oxidoreductase subunit H [Gemmatimonadales bacterium]
MNALLAWLALLLAAPLVPGIAVKTRALLTGRRGPPLWQPYLDLRKLLGRGAVYSRTTSWIFRLTPVALVAATLLATMLLPLDGRRSLVEFSGDMIAFAGMLGLGRFLLVLGALDTGSSFEGMGASREVTFASLIEPALLVSLVALSVSANRLTLSGILGEGLWSNWPEVAPTILLVAGSVFILMLAECARVPVDDPATHLELTMIHEVAALDHSGPDLALIGYASALKLATFSALLTSLLVPRAEITAWLAAPILLAGLATTGVAVGIVESSTARLRLPKVPLYIASAGALGFLGLILLLR